MVEEQLLQFREALLASIKFASWKVRRLESNLGPDKHIVDAIDWVLNDNDGVLDGVDAFPLDATESVDTDSDGIGNNSDTDDDGDFDSDDY